MRKVYQIIEQAAPTLGVGADLGRVGHRQGAGGADHPPAQPARRSAVRRRSTARRFPRRCSRARSSGTRRARSPAPSIAATAASSWPTAARCSSTRSPRWRRRRRSSCCACCRSGRFRRLGGRHEQAVDVRVIAATNVDAGRRGARAASCARTSTTGSTSSPSSCRRCASARRICRC